MTSVCFNTIQYLIPKQHHNYILSALYHTLWVSMQAIINLIDEKNDTIQHLHQLKLLNKDEVGLIITSIAEIQSEVITRFVADKIHKGDKEDFVRFATFMESHWALNYLLQYWKNNCKRQIFITM